MDWAENWHAGFMWVLLAILLNWRAADAHALPRERRKPPS